MNRRPGVRLAHRPPLALALVARLPAAAQTIYKLIDKNGKVTYAGRAAQGLRRQGDPRSTSIPTPTRPRSRSRATYAAGSPRRPERARDAEQRSR